MQTLHNDTRFLGIDARTAPDLLAPGFLTAAENVLLDADGRLSQRAGFSLTCGLGHNPSAVCPYETASGQAVLVVAGGRLYNMTGVPELGMSLTEIVNEDSATAFDLGSDVLMVRYGRYVYGTGQGGLWRFDPVTGTARYVSGLNPPALAPRVATSAAVLDSATDAATWQGVAPLASYVNLLSNPSFDAPGTNQPPNAPWTRPVDTGGTNTADSLTATGSSGRMTPQVGSYALLLDWTADAIEQEVVAPTVARTANGTFPAQTTKAARKMVVRLLIHQAHPAGESDLDVTLYALDGATTPAVLGQITANVTQGYQATAATWAVKQLVFDFSFLTVDPAKYRLRLQGGSRADTGLDGIYIDYAELVAVDPQAVIASAGGGISVKYRPLAKIYSPVNNTPGFLTVNDAMRATAGFTVTRGYAGVTGTANDYSDVSALYIGVQLAAHIRSAFLAVGTLPRFRVGFQTVGSTDVLWSPTGVWDADGASIGFDIAGVSPAAREQTTALHLQCLDSVPSTGDFPFDALFAVIGPIASGTALGVGLTYAYRVEEWRRTAAPPGPDDLLGYGRVAGAQSSGSPLSAEVTTTGLRAQVQVTLAPPVNTITAPAQGFYLLYRRGGTYDDGREWLVDVLPMGTSVLRGGVLIWDATTRVYQDNIPDSTLDGRPYYEIGRDLPPVNPSCIAVYGGRLALGAGNTIYLSWLLQDGIEEGIYFSNVSIALDDPNAALKGVSFTISSSDDSEPILSLTAFRGQLLVHRLNSFSVVTGSDPATLAASAPQIGPRFGLAAKRAICIAQNELWWLSGDGIVAYAGGGSDASGRVYLAGSTAKRGESVLPILREAGGPGLSGLAGWSSAQMLYHDGRVYVLVQGPPVLRPGSAPALIVANSRLLVYDARFGDAVARSGWTLLTGATFATLASFAGVRGSTLLLLGSNVAASQKGVFVFPTGPTSGASVWADANRSGTVPTVTIRSREYGLDGGGKARFSASVATQLELLATGSAAAAVTVLWSVVGRGTGPDAVATGTAIFKTGVRAVRIRKMRSVLGTTHRVDVVVAGAAGFGLSGIGLSVSERRVTGRG